MAKKQATKSKSLENGNAAPRQLKKPSYKSFKLRKKIKPHQPGLPSAFKLFKTSLGVIKSNKRLIIGITLIYALLTLVLVNGFGSSLNVSQLKEAMEEFVGGSFANLTIATTLFGALITSAGSSVSATGGVYQSVLLIIFSLATIYSLRKLFAKEAVSIKDSFYKGMYPLVPFLLVLLVIGLQLIPMAIGAWVYGLVNANNIAITAAEKGIWFIFFGLMVVLSMYMISSSIFGLIIVRCAGDRRPDG